MPMNPVCVNVDGNRSVDCLERALQNLDGSETELILDFSSVNRIDPGALRALEKLAGIAEDRAVKIVLRGVNIDIYRVLKLMKLAPRFSFAVAEEAAAVLATSRGR